MEGKGNISDYRNKLDKTLASPDLKSDEMIHTLVKNQILQSLDCQLEECNEYVVERRSKEMSNFLSMLRSASLNDSDESHSGWKVKQDTDEFRVMYREGPKGTPLHTLLVEGYVDGPLDVCLCISYESDLYKKWWPQSSIPTFKVISSQCVQKVRDGEQISLVRMKFSWPLSCREVLSHYFTFEYFQDGLIVVLFNSISDSETIDRSTHGFTGDGILNEQELVRIDLVGGFALQKVSQERSYFRTIANMDLKLDFVPPAFINFIARQLVGSGFKLYKKEVASVTQGDEIFREALNGPLYTRIHETFYPQNASMPSPALENLGSTSITLEEEHKEALEDNSAKTNNECVADSEATDTTVRDRKVLNEIEEFEEKDAEEESESLDQCIQESSNNLEHEITEEVRTVKTEVVEVEQAPRTTNGITENFDCEMKNKLIISPEVQHALGTLEKAISAFREYNSNPGKGQPDVKKGHSVNPLEDDGEKPISLEVDQITRNNGTCGESSEIRSTESTSDEPRGSSDNHGSRHKEGNSYETETKQSKISADETHSSPSHIKHIDLNSSMNQRTVPTFLENMAEKHSVSANGDRATKRKSKKSRFFCLSIMSR